MRLIAENLGGERGGEPVFSGIGFTLDKGEALVVTGPNGVGKSTLLRVVAGLLPARLSSAKVRPLRLERIETGTLPVASSSASVFHSPQDSHLPCQRL